ncbi:hypothetical protein C8R45DRAFT_213039 [Mycena sanguinolenta]|nr:hypothetical protein C8R45DRAFT_213039 [Mycena sanguinolenta]
MTRAVSYDSSTRESRKNFLMNGFGEGATFPKANDKQPQTFTPDHREHSILSASSRHSLVFSRHSIPWPELNSGLSRSAHRIKYGNFIVELMLFLMAILILPLAAVYSVVFKSNRTCLPRASRLDTDELLLPKSNRKAMCQGPNLQGKSTL